MRIRANRNFLRGSIPDVFSTMTSLGEDVETELKVSSGHMLGQR